MNKQIDVKVIIDDTIYSTSNEEDRKYLKEVLHDIGYRKTEDVAREIFAEIDGITDLFAGGTIGELEMYDMLGKLKKKYESEKDNG
jgi:hypothetical protein